MSPYCRLFKEPRNGFPAWRAGTGTSTRGYIGWRNQLVGIDSFAPQTFTNTGSVYSRYDEGRAIFPELNPWIPRLRHVLRRHPPHHRRLRLLGYRSQNFRLLRHPKSVYILLSFFISIYRFLRLEKFF
jgi:hypothetical protein